MNRLLPIRLSHLLRHCAVGSIVRGPDALMTIVDTRYWTDRQNRDAGRPLRYVDRVRAALGIEKELREPPIARENPNRQVDGVCIPARLFPLWARCPICGLLHFLPSLKKKDFPPKCQEVDKSKCQKRPPVEQVTYVVVHENGYLDDLPWHFLAHLNSKTQQQSQCRWDNSSFYLRLKQKSKSTKNETLECTNCNCRTDFNPYELNSIIKSMRSQPWLKERVELESPPEISKIHHIQNHFPHTKNALVIPPESRIRKGTIVDKLYSSIEKRRMMETCKTPLQWKTTIRRIAGEFKCNVEDVEIAWKDIQAGYPMYGKELQITPGQLREDEYRALMEIIPDVSEDEDFVTRHLTTEWQQLAKNLHKQSIEFAVFSGIDRLISVSRLKEIMVFEGFSRLSTAESTVVKPDITGESSWLPAVELFGEGLFITLNEKKLCKWEKHAKVAERTSFARKRYEHSPQIFHNELLKVTPRFLLLHSLSHLLIRQMETDAGYPAASLRERIYCREGDIKMAGILIYVAVPDIVGSLGGIMELAEPRSFLNLATAAVSRSRWCSLDPVCSEHEGQGLHLLNRAACHACLLLPETSCDYCNTLLDRVYLKGDAREGLPGFFGFSFKTEG